ncbi:pyrroline-5-carboxylate reductase [Bacteroides heparinolyticus]|uniref:pyrroline-5-carboxylate reductase n=1 Tax=Prevotella heparinolytica TaxID=28113 RepID=UPI00359F3010
MAKIVFIGMGNMGQAMLKGLLSLYRKEDLAFTETDRQKALSICESTGVAFVPDSRSLIKGADYIICAVKPQVYESVYKNLEGWLEERQIFISIAPGISIESIKARLKGVRVLRAMPNTPALVLEGMTALAYTDFLSREEEEEVAALFSAFGRYQRVEEKYMDAVVCISGSTPAYMYAFAEAIADTGLKLGLTKEDALLMVAQTMLGSAKMLLETGEHPSVLKDRVCSPGGTTIAALLALEEHGFNKAVQKAGEACYQRCLELKK